MKSIAVCLSILMLAATFVFAEDAAPEAKTVTASGVLKISKDNVGAVTAMTLVDEEGNAVKLEVNQKLADSDGKNVEITGVETEMEGVTYIVVKTCKVVEEEEAPAAE